MLKGSETLQRQIAGTPAGRVARTPRLQFRVKLESHALDQGLLSDQDFQVLTTKQNDPLLGPTWAHP